MGKNSAETAFIPGWSYRHRNTPKTTFVTTTNGANVNIGDFVSFYLDPDSKSKAHKHVGTSAQVVKQADATKVKWFFHFRG